MNIHDCIIIGSGPAGYTAAIYMARYGKTPLMFTGLQLGGQLTQTTDVDNFPGYPKGIQGIELMTDLQEQAERFGTQIIYQTIEEIDTRDRPFKLMTNTEEVYYAHSVIVATGASAKWLGLPNETQYFGKGLSACATCDGYFYKGKDVLVVGGGDTAIEEAFFLAGLARKVYVLVRKDYMRASQILIDRLANYSNIEVQFNKEVVALLGDQDQLTGVEVLDNTTHTQEVRAIDGVFIAIGHQPNTHIFKNKLALDAQEYIRTQKGSTYTNIPGIQACGDVQDTVYRQAITAAGTGCMAAIDTQQFLANRLIKNGFYCVPMHREEEELYQQEALLL